jgi:hypothetical protein
LNALEAAADISVQNFLTKDGPNHLSTGLDAGGVYHPGFVVGKLSAVEIHAAQPDEDDGQMAKVSTKDFARNIF